MNHPWTITTYHDRVHREPLQQLWSEVFAYETPHNDPALSLLRKIEAQDGLLFVAVTEAGEVIGSIMAGYDGHRGWLYSLAVRSANRRAGIGTALVTHAEHALTERGCVKINLQVLETNPDAIRFYERLGFRIEPRVSLGKILSGNVPGASQESP